VNNAMPPENVTAYEPTHSSKSNYYGIIFLVILAVPIGALMFLFLQGPVAFTAVMGSVLLAVLLLLGYLTFSAGHMKYQLSNTHVQVNIGLIKKKIAYQQIASVEAAELKLNLRLFGASLPGLHWGLFRTSIGNAHVYATRIDGEFVVLTLVDGEKLVLSPAQPLQFLEAAKAKTAGAVKGVITKPDLSVGAGQWVVYAQVLAVFGAYLVFVGYFFAVYAALPETVPVHFGFDGVANRWGNKSELLFLLGIGAIFPAVNAVLSLKFGKHENGLTVFLGAVFIAVIALFIFIVNSIAAAA
jgi:hypothetical protein